MRARIFEKLLQQQRPKFFFGALSVELNYQTKTAQHPGKKMHAENGTKTQNSPQTKNNKNNSTTHRNFPQRVAAWIFVRISRTIPTKQDKKKHHSRQKKCTYIDVLSYDIECITQ